MISTDFICFHLVLSYDLALDMYFSANSSLADFIGGVLSLTVFSELLD
jgi:hypothetical protein